MTYDSKTLGPCADAHTHRDTIGRPAARRMGRGIQNHVATLLAWGEIDFILGCRESGFAMEHVRHHQRKLFLMQPQGGAGLRRDAESPFDDDDQQFPTAGLEAHRVAGDHTGGVDEFHSGYTRSRKCFTHKGFLTGKKIWRALPTKSLFPFAVRGIEPNSRCGVPMPE